jgi:HTH-type transcriptional regulator/antitoxin HipB
MNNFTPKTFAVLSKMLIWHRKRSKMSQQVLADLAGVSRTAVQRVECGITPVQMDTLLKILNILNIEMSYNSPLMQSYIETISKHSSESEDA